MELMEARLKISISESKSEIKSEINKLIIWIVATMFAAAGLMITLAKVFFTSN
jgi:hypothetical protein